MKRANSSLERDLRFRLEFAYRVVKRRDALSLSQEDVAKRVGCTRTSVVNTEAGRQLPRLQDLSQWAAALKCRMAYLLGEVSKP